MNWDEKRGGLSLDSTRCSFQKWAMTLATEREFDVMVTGHTHLGRKRTARQSLVLE